MLHIDTIDAVKSRVFDELNNLDIAAHIIGSWLPENPNYIEKTIVDKVKSIRKDIQNQYYTILRWGSYRVRN
jgi:DNA-directed RNA polymerase